MMSERQRAAAAGIAILAYLLFFAFFSYAAASTGAGY